MARSILLLFLSLCLTACLPELGGWTVSPTRSDSGVRPGEDGGVRPGEDAGPTTGGPCGTPTLFAAAHQLGDGPGRVLRWEIQGTGGLIPCRDLTGSGALDVLPFAIAPVSDRLLIVASRSSVQAVDPLEDRLLWEIPVTGLHPNDAFVVDDATRGRRVPVVAWSTLGGSASTRGTIRQIDSYGDNVVLDSWSGSDLALGNATAMSASPLAATEALAMNSNVYAAADVALFGAGRRDPPRVGPFADTAIRTVSGGRTASGAIKLVWVASQMGEPGVYIGAEPWAGPSDFEGVGTCGSDICNPLHVVLDPTLNRSVFAICSDYGPYGELVRIDLEREVCETWADSARLPDLRLSYLAVLP